MRVAMRIRLALLVPAFLTVTVAGAWAQASGKPGRYVDPDKRFAMSIPPDAAVVASAGQIKLRINSAKGFLVNVQTGPANPALSLQQMAAKLESRYMGQHKAWTHKTAERDTTVSRLPAYDALYQGQSTRVRVVIARGQRTDFVFMFFSPSQLFDGFTEEFEWILAHFVPAADEVPPAAAKDSMTAAASPKKGVAKSGPNRFSDRRSGYAVDYPADWVFARSSPYTVIFSGAEGTDAYFATVSIQNIRPPNAAAGGVAAAVLADLKAQLAAGATQLDYFGEADYTYDRGDVHVMGREFLVTYTRQNRRFRQWSVVMPRPAGGIVHVWSYTAPETHFDAFRNVAQEILESWDIQPEGG